MRLTFKGRIPTTVPSFFKAKQAQGQCMTDYVIQLRQMFEEADMHEMDYDEMLMFKYLCTCSSNELRKELLKLQEPDLQEVEDFITAWEVSRRSDKEVRKTDKPAKADVVKSDSTKPGKNQPMKTSSTKKTKKKMPTEMITC